MSGYRTAPVASKTMPKGIPYIISNEAAERFSYYGMRGILVIFMTKYLLDADGNLDLMAEAEARVWYHTFSTAVYFLPLIGAIVADAFLGKYRTILSLSIVYCLGHLALAVDETRLGLSIGLALIAMGSGGIKPCVSAHVGDQFGKSNQHLLEKVFQYFYFSINFGSFFSTIMTPVLLDKFGPHVAFGVPGALMLLATIAFWMGRNVFIHIPPGGMGFIRETFSKEGLKSIGKLFIIYVFVAMFWALFDQTGSAWVLQAERMDRRFAGIEWLSAQIHSINPILVMVFIPLCAAVIYPAISKVFPLTPLRKISIGFFITVPAFVLPAWIESQIAQGEFPNILWQLLAYAIITLAEVFVSITCLEFSYTQAPKRMKSLVMAAFLTSVSLGNLFVAGVNVFIQNPTPGFVPDVPGEYVVRLDVRDADGARVSTTTTITVVDELPEEEPQPPTDEPPSAEAGRFVAVAPGSPVRMYASASEGDAEGDQSFSWRFDSVPSGSQLTADRMTDAAWKNPVFTPDVPGEYVLRFTNTVGEQTVEDTVRVLATTENVAPIASAGDARTVAFAEGEAVSLDGSDSYDPDGDALTYYWRFVDVPSGSSVTDAGLTGRHFPAATTTLEGESYYYFFTVMMLLTALLFIPVAVAYKEKTYIQDEDDAEGAPVPATEETG